MIGGVVLTVLVVSGVSMQDVQNKSALHCGKREFMNKTDNTHLCQTCPDQTYMDIDEHTYLSCKKCKMYYPGMDAVEKVEPCTRDRDTVVTKCKDGLYVQYDSSLERYKCARCRTTDCQENVECCSYDIVTTTTASTPTASTPSTTSDDSTKVKPETYQHKDEKCEKVVTKGCLKAEYVNRTCLHVQDSVEQSLLCQSCPNINTNICTAAIHDPDSPLSSHGAIGGIVVGSVICIVIVVVVFYCCCIRRNKKQNHSYHLTEPTDKADVENSTTAVMFNSRDVQIVIEQ